MGWFNATYVGLLLLIYDVVTDILVCANGELLAYNRWAFFVMISVSVMGVLNGILRYFTDSYQQFVGDYEIYTYGSSFRMQRFESMRAILTLHIMYFATANTSLINIVNVWCGAVVVFMSMGVPFIHEQRRRAQHPDEIISCGTRVADLGSISSVLGTISFAAVYPLIDRSSPLIPSNVSVLYIVYLVASGILCLMICVRIRRTQWATPSAIARHRKSRSAKAIEESLHLLRIFDDRTGTYHRNNFR